MYSSGQMQLQSMSWLNSHTGDRPSFEATVPGLFSTRPYKVFAMPQGFLFLQVKRKRSDSVRDGNRGAVTAGFLLGGLLGAAIAAGVTSGQGVAQHEPNYDLMSEEELLALAKQRKRSFVVKNDEITAASIEAPGTWARMFGDNHLAGFVTLRSRSLGTVKMELLDQASMSVAVDALPRRLGDRVFVNVELDRSTTRFVARGRG